MCLGSEARAANKAAMQNYEHKLKVRERKWMNELGLIRTQRVQYDQTLDAAHVGLGNAYAEIQEKYGDLISEARQEQEEKFKEFASTSKAADLAASGRTGRSVQRMETLELGQYLAQGSRAAFDLLQNKRDLDMGKIQMQNVYSEKRKKTLIFQKKIT